MPAEPNNPGGWLDSVARIVRSLTALAQNRFELFTVELQEEKLRLLKMLVWLVLAATLGVAGVLVAITTLAFWLWASVGYVGLIGLSVATLTVAGGILWTVRRRLQTGPPPFAQTVDEFRKDTECLRTGH